MTSVLRRCHELDHAGLQERKEAWAKRHVSVTEAMYTAQPPAIKEVQRRLPIPRNSVAAAAQNRASFRGVSQAPVSSEDTLVGYSMMAPSQSADARSLPGQSFPGCFIPRASIQSIQSIQRTRLRGRWSAYL
jgi:hypothetical protein